MHTDTQGVEHPITLKPHTENGADQHYAVCDECGARWAGPFASRPVAAAVARSMNEDAAYVPPKQLRTELCCVEWVPDEAPGVPVAVETEPGVSAPSGWATAGQVAVEVGKAGVFLGYALFVIGRGLFAAVAGLVRLVVALGWLMIPIVAVVVFVLSKMPRLPQVGTADLVVWVGTPVALGVAGLAAWRFAHPRKSAEPTYSTPLTTAPRAANVVGVSKTPADSKPQGETAGAAGTRHTTGQ